MNKLKAEIKRITPVSLMMLLILSVLWIVPAAVAGENETIGILVVAHGSPNDDWCDPVREAVTDVDLPYPVELGFLELVPNQTINNAVDKLDDAGVTKIIAVPLFISSHSNHIQEIEYVLGLRDSLPLTSMHVNIEGVEMDRSIIRKGDKYVISHMPVITDKNEVGNTGNPLEEGKEEEELIPVETDVEIVMTGAMDDHWLIANIVADHTYNLSVNPANETLVLVAHGTEEEENFEEWVNNTTSLADQARLKLKCWSDPSINISGVEAAFLHHNETLHPEFISRSIVENASEPIIVPLMVSQGFFTGQYIPMQLENLSYAYDGMALTPHPNMSEWIEMSAAKEFANLTLGIYDDEDLLNISIDEIGEAHGHICLCVAVAFRVSQTALLAFDEVPARGDLEIIYGHPSDGHYETFEYILNSSYDYTIELPEGTDMVNFSLENYQYRFIERLTGNEIVVSVKEGIFPDGFFEMRAKCKQKVATEDEKIAFEQMKGELKDKFLYLPAEEILEVQSKIY